LNASLEGGSALSSGTFVPVFLPILRDQTSLRTWHAHCLLTFDAVADSHGNCRFLNDVTYVLQ
jgi:hypothetical protein